MNANKARLLDTKIRLLKHCKSYLSKTDPWSGLCKALRIAAHDIASHTAASHRARVFQADQEIEHYIRRALENETYLNNWLTYRLDKKTRREVCDMRFEHPRQYRDRMYATRMAWIDWMIDQYQQQLQEGA